MSKSEERKILMELVEDNRRAFQAEMAELKQRMDTEDDAAIERDREFFTQDVQGVPRRKAPRLVLLKQPM